MRDDKDRLKIPEKLREALEDRIITGHYPAGMRLDETELATEFKVSRTPVREALIQLSSSDLIEIRPRRGAVVATVPHRRVFEMFEVMAELEAMSARLAARRRSPTDLAHLGQHLDACRAARDGKDTEAYYDDNERFHRAVHAASHNQFLFEKVTLISRRLRAYRKLQLRLWGRLNASCDEHTRIFEAITAGNADLAAGATRKHVVVQGENFADLLASINQTGLGSRAAAS